VDESATSEKIQKEQQKHWRSWISSLNEGKTEFTLKDQTPGTMKQVLEQSSGISISVQSALLVYPLESYKNLFDQLLGILPDTNIEISTRLIQALSPVRLPAPERKYIANLICAYKFHRKPKSDSTIDWNCVEIANYPVDDISIKSQLENAERCIFALRHSEQQRKAVCLQVPSKVESPGNLFDLITKHRESVQEQIQQLEYQRQRRVQGDPLLTEKSIAQRAELERLTQEREGLLQQILDKESQLASLETPRASMIFDGKIGSIQSELLPKQQALEAHKLTLEKYLQFYQTYFLPNHQRLSQIHTDVEKSIYSSASEAPALINRYLESASHLLQDLRKRMKRVRKDLKRISKSYGPDAVVPIQGEYTKLKELFLDLAAELEDVMMIYVPLLAPIQQWLDYCSSNNIDPFSHHVVTTSKVDEYLQSIKATPGVRLALTALLEGFSYPPYGGLQSNFLFILVIFGEGELLAKVY
jgi:hypothetical protein